ncbi:nitric oxide synthase oxygenase [Kutzneria sp. CA-103260]|uniref:nitric oxide synthase oxygenase n=1 Tax=Kutzneria sp. CA-103260 TaxID=2802641 RepID=UPI002740B69B|nr:nitric oxide synthase oxygenase [Kutzneria sp. CA-103260]
MFSDPHRGRRLGPAPDSPDAVQPIHLTHPEHAWCADLTLRWYAVPAITNM